MESVLLSNPIYQHSGETEKDFSVAQQACINEEQEQRRRQLDARGENQKVIVAKEVAHMVDEFGGHIQLKQTPFTVPSEPILEKAAHVATGAISSAFEAGKSFFSSASSVASSAVNTATSAASSAVSTATSAASSAVNTATSAASSAAGKVSAATKEVTNTAVHLGHDAADFVQHKTKDAADYVQHAAHEAAQQASSAAEVVGQKTKEFAEGAANKAYEIADNINHFTTLVSVLAEEENERARRLVSGDEARAAANAFRVSELIRDLGIAFYKQTPNLLYTTKILEETERRWRLNSSHSSVAENNAHNVGKIVHNNLQNFMPRYEWVRSNIANIEEKERTRRLNDTNETYAILNALNLSYLIRELGLGFYRQEGTFSRLHGGYATTLLEEIERRNRIREDRLTHTTDSAHLLMDVVANNMEKFNYTTRHAAQFANEFANMIGTATKSIASNFTALTQDFAKSAASRVKTAAGEIANYSNLMYVIALEERERARRLSDSSEITAINNAWIQSGLIRELEGLYRSSHRATYPIGLIEEQERRWRMSSDKNSSSSRKLADIVRPNLAKFELGSQRMSKLEHAIGTASHSKLNPNAPSFVPKIEPAPIKSVPLAYGAQS